MVRRFGLLLIVVVLFCASSLRGADPERAIPFDPDWTPRPMVGDDVPWFMKETDVNWVDGRLRKMDTGRSFNATFRYSHDGKELRAFKGTALRLGERGEVGMLFDRNQLRWACTWTCEPFAEPSDDNPTGFTPYLEHSDRRFGLLNTPAPKGEMLFSSPMGLGVIDVGGSWKPMTAPTGPPPQEGWRFSRLQWRGQRPMIQLQKGNQFEREGQIAFFTDAPWVYSDGDERLITHKFGCVGKEKVQTQLLMLNADEVVTHKRLPEPFLTALEIKVGEETFWVTQTRGEATYEPADGRVVLAMSSNASPTAFLAKSRKLTLAKFLELSTAAHEQNQEYVRQTQPLVADAKTLPITTQLDRAPDDSPYVIDTLSLPYENPYRALIFASAIEFLPRAMVTKWRPDGVGDNVLAMATVHGDVWLIDGVDSPDGILHWKRLATGLYQPMGLKLVGEKLFVLERGQLTQLVDKNQDGTADEMIAFNMDAHVTGGEHSYHTSLETDLEGNFYFHAGGDTNGPTGGTVIKVSADGERSEVFCTGFRHPIGLGVLPDGRITGADQEGNWMPSTRIDIYKKGGFYGDMRAHHRDVAPTTYDGPLCWLPRQMDNSAGGQIFVNRDDFGPLSRKMLHLSYGQCRIMELLMQEHAGIDQAGAVDIGLQFLSGITRGKFRDSDGHLYVVGMDGWQTAAKADGCLQRVRYTGKPSAIPVALTIERGGILLEFSLPIVKEANAKDWSGELAADPRRYHVEQWNYLWTKEYGSKRYSVEHPDEEGQDVLSIESATIESPWKVFLKVRGLRPVMQMQIEYDIIAFGTDEKQTQQPLKGTIYNTVHTTGSAIEFLDGDRVSFIGGTLIEREQRTGYWEHALTVAHPDKHIIFRNLGWSGDTVWAESRGIFESPAKGYEQLLQQVKDLSPTVLILNYGSNEAWAGPEGLDRFITQYNKLIDDLTTAAKPPAVNPGEQPALKPLPLRIVLLGPLPMETGSGPNSHPTEYNTNVALYSQTIEKLAREKELPYIDLAKMYTWHQQVDLRTPRLHRIPATWKWPPDRQPLTENGLHLTPYGYERTAPWFAAQFGPSTSHDPQKSLRPSTEDTKKLLTVIREKNELYFHRWRPQNITYLFLFRKHEQGNNAIEIPQFDPLITAAEQEITTLKKPPQP